MLAMTAAGCKKTDDTLTKVTLNEVAHSIFYAPQYVAIEQGYFKDEGIELNLVTGFGADKVMTALISGEAQIGFMGSESSIYAYNEGNSDYAVNFAQLTQRAGNFLVSREPIDDFSWDMLKGCVVLGGRAGGMPEMVLEYILKNNGLDVKQDDPKAEVNVRTDVQFDVLAGVFQAGQSDFVALFEPSATQVVKNGVGHIVASLGESSGIIPYTAYSTLKNTMDKNGDMLKKFTKAIDKAIKYCYTEPIENIAKVVQNDFLSSPLDEIEMILQNYRNIEAWATDMHITKENFDKLLTIIEMAGEINSKDTIDYNKLVTDKYL